MAKKDTEFEANLVEKNRLKYQLSCTQNTVEQLQSECSALNAKLTKMRTDETCLLGAIANFEGDLTDMQAKAEKLSEQLTNAETSLREMQCDDSRKGRPKAASLENEIALLKKVSSSLNSKLADKRRDESALRAKIPSLQTALIETENKRESAFAQLADAQQRVVELQAKYDEVISVCSSSSDERTATNDASSELRGFKIPKRTVSNDECLRRVRFDDREVVYSVLPALRSCYGLEKESNARFSYSDFFMVENAALSRKFEEKRKWMKLQRGPKSACSESELVASYAFLSVATLNVARSIAMGGVLCGNRAVGRLGKPEMGVYLCRKSDIISPAPLEPGFSGGYIVIFKLLRGRVRAISPEETREECLEPSFLFDSFIAKESSSVSSGNFRTLFEHHQIYVYELDDLIDSVGSPRQILPWAVVKYRYDFLDWTTVASTITEYGMKVSPKN